MSLPFISLAKSQSLQVGETLECDIVAERYCTTGNNTYFFTTEEKSRKMLKNLKKKENLEQEKQLLQRKLRIKESVIENKDQIIQDYKMAFNFVKDANKKKKKIKNNESEPIWENPLFSFALGVPVGGALAVLTIVIYQPFK